MIRPHKTWTSCSHIHVCDIGQTQQHWSLFMCCSTSYYKFYVAPEGVVALEVMLHQVSRTARWIMVISAYRWFSMVTRGFEYLRQVQLCVILHWKLLQDCLVWTDVANVLALTASYAMQMLSCCRSGCCVHPILVLLPCLHTVKLRFNGYSSTANTDNI